MYILLFFVFLFMILVLLLFTRPLALFFTFDTNADDMHLSACWMHPFLKLTVKIENSVPIYSVYIFGKHLTSKAVGKKAGKDRSLLQAAAIKDPMVKAYYGIYNPFMFGILYGAIAFVKALFHIEIFEQYPELMPLNEYICIEAEAKLNLGKTLVNIIRLKLKNHTNRRRNIYGPVKSS